MSDKCFNTFSFFGNKKVILQVQSWRNSMEALQRSNSKEIKNESPIFETLLPEVETNALNWFGQKWVYPDFGSEIDLHENELGFVSAWSSPDGLQDLITEKLSKIDSHVVVLNIYSDSEHTESFRYSAIDAKGNIQSEGTYLRLIDGNEDDFDYQLFYEHQRDCIEDLISKIPGLKKVLSKELKRVEKLFASTF